MVTLIKLDITKAKYSMKKSGRPNLDDLWFLFYKIEYIIINILGTAELKRHKRDRYRLTAQFTNIDYSPVYLLCN
jgi:hypothetical protein